MGKEATKGTIIENKYRLERELGAGGMGSVWLATQLMVDRPVAVKLLHPAFDDEKEIQARFEVEAKAIGKLNHPNVITLYDFGFSKDLEAFYTAIEYIDGVSLDKRLHERIPLREIVDIIRQTALALDHAHHHGILHRDLKPENVMLARMTDGTQIVKVLDFGIARIVKGSYDTESPDSQRITKAGEVFGTPAYMSPEQARSIRRLTPASDLYSLGIMLYELVVGKLPFFAKSAFDLLMLHVTKPVPPIRRPDVPDALIKIIYRLLEKEPERRFQTGRELAVALAQLQLPEEPAAFDPGEGTPTLRTQSPFTDLATQRLDPTHEDPPPAPGPPQYETNPAGAPFVLPTPSGEYRQQQSGEYRQQGDYRPQQSGEYRQQASGEYRQQASGEYRQQPSGEYHQYGTTGHPNAYGHAYPPNYGAAARQGPTQETEIQRDDFDWRIAVALGVVVFLFLSAVGFLISWKSGTDEAPGTRNLPQAITNPPQLPPLPPAPAPAVVPDAGAAEATDAGPGADAGEAPAAEPNEAPPQPKGAATPVEAAPQQAAAAAPRKSKATATAKNTAPPESTVEIEGVTEREVRTPGQRLRDAVQKRQPGEFKRFSTRPKD